MAILSGQNVDKLKRRQIKLALMAIWPDTLNKV